MLQTDPTHNLKRVADRLHVEFRDLPHPHVELCVADAWKCAEHLGFEATTSLVERVAREHLQAVVNSAPPSTAPIRPRTGQRDRR